MPDRSIIFIDGNNWFHSARDAGIRDLFRLNYGLISKKLLGPREWLETRYYIGRIDQSQNSQLYADQRRFISHLTAQDKRITAHFGRIESHPEKNPLADELLGYLTGLPVRIDQQVYRELFDLAKAHQSLPVYREKAVDVMLAVDMVVMAVHGAYDSAYLVSADGDFTPAVAFVRSLGKKVYAAAPTQGAQLGAAVNAYIKIDIAWLRDCYG